MFWKFQNRFIWERQRVYWEANSKQIVRVANKIASKEASKWRWEKEKSVKCGSCDIYLQLCTATQARLDH